MDPIDNDDLDEAANVDVRRLKRVLAARDDATREFQRAKAALLRRLGEYRGRTPAYE